MKNIHVLPTEKQSRLAYDFDKLILNSRLLSPILYKTQNIYITNYEEIKDKDYVLSDASIGALYLDGVMNTDSMLAEGQWKKIILTTDEDLIKDGVQEIPDDFLEWFVKNPSCEEVKTQLKLPWESSKDEYEIIIPKEEPKQSIKDIILSETPESVKQKVREAANALVNKQETTLEEAKDLNYWKNNAEEDYLKVPISVLRYITELEKQQERSYSEEEVLDLLCARNIEFNLYEGRDKVEEWFEQFKKK